jgi:hypothetical protein
MDAWVMNRSWAHPCYTVYEIKVSRSDFLNDKKWRGYLSYGNEFYFVAPKGLIDPSELPPEAGLLELLGGPQGRRLVRRKKAPWRDIEPPEQLFRYVLMCRVKVGRSEYLAERTKDERAGWWREFVRERVEQRELGYQVGKAIREKAEHVERENQDLKRRMEGYDSIQLFLNQIGMDAERHVSQWDVERRLQEMRKVFDQTLIWSMESLHHELTRAIDQAKKIQEEDDAEQSAIEATA